MSHSFCEPKDERGLRIKTKAEQFMTDTAFFSEKKNQPKPNAHEKQLLKEIIPLDYGHSFAFSIKIDI